MNKLLAITLMALMGLTACTASTGGGSEAAQVALDTSAVIQRVEEIYAGVFDVYNNTSDLGMPDKGLDSLYCSRDWNNALTAVAEHDKKLSDSMGYWEADYWIMGQDWQDLAISDVRVTRLADTTATVELNLHNCGDVKAVRLEMVQEDGMWKIDDFIDLKTSCDWKADMKEYIQVSKVAAPL